jgi:membrane AbrB-like protein
VPGPPDARGGPRPEDPDDGPGRAGPWWSRLGVWALVAAGVALASTGLGAVGLSDPTLFAALLVGLVVALVVPRRAPRVPVPARVVAQGAIGVLTGALVQPSTLASLADDWWTVLLVVLATLLLSVLAGVLLARHRDVDVVTGSFAMVAGGASGITVMARELGADQRMVAVVQYLRVLLILLAMPAVAAALPQGSADASAAAVPDPGPGADVLFTAVVVGLGALLQRRLPLPAGALLWPMLIATGASATGLSHGAGVPDALLVLAYAAIGLGVGLSFTRSSLRAVGRALPLAVGLIVALVVATAAISIPLLRLTGASTLDAYLASTPGGLYAVLATAVSSGADTTLVLAVQVLRLLVMVLVAPLLATALRRWAR